ncbi:MAG: SpoIIE family protein phosphatase [Flavobacteriales bacterium]|nr:SpoIIE family protein phosphatase [Flavobacteriales bacterium]
MNYIFNPRWLLAIALFLVCSISLQAQTGNFVNYGLEDGLITSQIEALTQDSRGNLWIGTIGGLSKYDGYDFINYTEKNGLAEDWITSLLTSKSGTIWIGHWGGGVSMFDIKSRQFKDLKLENYSEYKLISSIQEDQDGMIWIATEGAGIFKYDPTNETASKVSETFDGKVFKDLELDANGYLWAGGPEGITILDPSNNNIISESKGDFEVSDLESYQNTEMWVATSNGIFRYTTNKNGLAELQSKGRITTSEGLSSNYVKCLFADNKSNVWIGTLTSGILRFISNGQKKGELIDGSVELFSNKIEMDFFNANAFYQDREGNLWVGTEIGLNKYMGDLFKIYNTYDGLANNLVWSILAESNTRLWFGTTEGLSLATFQKENGIIKYGNPKVQTFSKSSGLPESIVISLFKDSKERIWVGTEHNGVAVMNSNGRVIKTLKAKDLADGKIFSISEDKNGFVWLGTKNGANKIHPETFKVETFNEENGLGGNKIYSLFKDSKNRLWFGILGGSLTVYDGDKFKVFDKSEFNEQFVVSITEDMEKNVWFAVYGSGLYMYDGAKFDHLTTRHGLSSNRPMFLSCDKENNMWIGQNLGIEKYDQKEAKFSLFGQKQGFNGLETNENAASLDSDGNIWFGSLRGAIKFNPKSYKVNNIEPITSIVGLQLFREDTILENDVKLAYDKNHLTFKVRGLSLINPSEVRYKYMLDGFSSSWSPATAENSITYSNIPPGNYVFKVIACNNSNIYNETPATFSFVVKPPFWQTWWFYLLCASAIAFAIYSYIKIREKKLKERQIYLEEQVEKRTEELRKEKETVEKQNKNIRESISYAKRIQEAILPPKDIIKKSLEEYFLYYKPKDIVSGDFYWVHEVENKVLFAAVDCTGHGVPGAFMSIIGHNLLEKVVNESSDISPSHILDLLSREVAETLHQNDENNDVKDGMDLAICSIDKNTLEMEYSGAYNPAYVIRNGELNELKGDKLSIGTAQLKNEKFQGHSFKLEKGDLIYLFSDGYADQKGGPKNKKFYYAPFRQLLIDIHKLPLEQQKEHLDKTISEWRGSVEQYDDMLIFGVKV